MNKYTNLRVPNEWQDRPNAATELIENFIACKVPLSNIYDSKLTMHTKFNMSNLITSVKEKFNKEIGLVIDLTNTDRYYDYKYDVLSRGIKYAKLPCLGYDAPPTEENVKSFIKEIDEYRLTDNKVIAVHCTHGYNRTGFLICAYLVEKLNYKINDAIDKFKSVRNPGIYKEEYIIELNKRYN